jgi:hypothetical protein
MARKIKKNVKQFFDKQKVDKPHPHFKLINGILGGLFIGSIFLTILEINIYRKTFIPFLIPLAIWILTGVFVTPFYKRFLTIYFSTPYLFLQFFFNVVTWGGFVLFAFMWTNYNFTDKQIRTTNEKITSIGHLARGRYGNCQQPFVMINYNGQDKQLVYYCGTQIELYKSVDLTVAKGLFGYDIIVQSELKAD